MNDIPLIRGKPASAYRYAIILTQDHNDDIEVEQFPGGNFPSLDSMLALLANGADTIRTQIVLAGVSKFIHDLKIAGESDKVKLLSLQLANEQAQIAELMKKCAQLQKDLDDVRRSDLVSQ